RYSEDPAGRAGGDTGWFKVGEFAQSFEAAVGKLTVGEIGQPVRTEFGFHLIKLVDERRKEITEALVEQLTAQVRMRMLQKERTKVYKRWLQSLRRDAFIEIRGPSEAKVGHE
ncbi:MAG: peptidylprolyl isomerase, partial [Myxococcota bacterium]|nr:peptidylprolyl isomerase [Myxococcota bacterium]